MKGATAYEYQWGRVYLRVVHLWGGHWNWMFWRRFSLRIVPKESA